MADVITRFKLETTQFDSKLRDTSKALRDIAHQAELGGKDFDKFSDEAIKSAKALGTVQSGATNTKDKLRDLVGSYNDAAKAYNSLTETAKKGEFGRAMSQSLTQLQQRIKETKQELYSLNDAKGAGGLFGGSNMSGMLQVFGGNVLTKIAGVGVGFASELKDMVKQGVELARAGEGVRIAFERLGRGDLLKGLREATHGTVTDLELMKAAVKFNDFKLPVEELGTMLAFAQQKAKDTGQSVDYMVDSIVTGLGRKSLMILDNLGLSATEIRDKMKETGDMTKAVGEIIREQMAKAGDYVETAADRATKANVELENAMTRLGETFQPLTDAANSMWTDIKVGALDLLNNAVRPLINALTEAGRMRAVYEGQSGDARVNRQLDRLKGIQTDNYRQGTYKAQLRSYDASIASHEQYLKDYKAWQSDKTNVGAYDRMQAFKRQTGLEWVSDVQAHLDAFKKMRSEYVQGAKAILAGNPAPSPTDTPTTPTGGGSGSGNNSITLPGFVPAAGEKYELGRNFQSLFGDEEFVNIQRKLMGMDGEPTRDWGKELGKVLANYVDDPDKDKRKKTKEKEDTDFMSDFGKVTNSVTNIASGLQSLGVEIPEGLAKTIGVIQTISGILSAILAITTVISATSEANAAANWLDALIPFAKGGMIRAARGYYVPGTHNSGDVTPILANAGELVLNKSSQNNLANDLKGAEALVQSIDRYQASVMGGAQSGGSVGSIQRNDGANGGGGSPYLTGEIIYLGLSAYLKSSGRGEIVTSRAKG